MAGQLKILQNHTLLEEHRCLWARRPLWKAGRSENERSYRFSLLTGMFFSQLHFLHKFSLLLSRWDISNRSICPAPTVGLWKCILKAPLQNSFYKLTVKNSREHHQCVKVLFDHRGVSRSKIITWKFKGKKIFTIVSCRKTCRTLLGAEWMCTGCYLASNALHTQTETASLLPLTEKKAKKANPCFLLTPLSTLDSSNTPRCQFLLGYRSFLCSCQPFEILEMQLKSSLFLKVQPLLLQVWSLHCTGMKDKLQTNP